MAETTLLSLRPTRLISFQYYVLWIVLWVFSAYLFLDWWDVIPDAWVLPLLNVRVQTALGVLVGLIGLLSVLTGEIRRLWTRYVITDLRIIRKDGIVRRRTMEIPFTQIERVELEQGLLQRILKYGDLVIDTGDDTVVLNSLRHVTLIHSEVTKHVGVYSPTRTR